MSKPSNTVAAEAWSMKRLMLGIGVLFVFIQLTTLVRVYALNYIDNLNSPGSEIIRDRIVGTVVGLTFIAIIISLSRYLFIKRLPSWQVVLAHLGLIVPITFAWYVVFAQIALWLCQVFRTVSKMKPRWSMPTSSTPIRWW
ncbi:MAG: hypothetical protein R2795_22435 [Saprospiraceae bacterium]